MKVQILYQDKIMSTKLSRGVKVKDLIFNLKNSPQLKNLLKKEDELKLLNENLISAYDEDIIQINENKEKKFEYKALRKIKKLKDIFGSNGEIYGS